MSFNGVTKIHDVTLHCMSDDGIGVIITHIHEEKEKL